MDSTKQRDSTGWLPSHNRTLLSVCIEWTSSPNTSTQKRVQISRITSDKLFHAGFWIFCLRMNESRPSRTFQPSDSQRRSRVTQSSGFHPCPWIRSHPSSSHWSTFRVPVRCYDGIHHLEAHQVVYCSWNGVHDQVIEQTNDKLWISDTTEQ